jgi:predicted O-linked N-acetylglucosamine transferase (SPINDLY family)
MDLDVSPSPAESNGYVTFGSLNNFCKINHPVLKLWARVLRAVPGSRLQLLAVPGSHCQRTRELLEREGIEGHRVTFEEPRDRQGYLALYHHVDIGLDPFPYNGHTTSLDAFWMGVPVLSLVGRHPLSRGGWSQLSNLGLRELAAFTEDDFVPIAVRLANDLPRLAELRRTLRSRMQSSPLMDGPRFARSVEVAYRAAWRHWCLGQ